VAVAPVHDAGARYDPRMVEPTMVPARYDALAEGYARHWGPVIRPAAEALLDRLGAPPSGSRILDLGAGTGTLALRALERWPDASVSAVDVSDAMLELARADAGRRLPVHARRRLSTVTAPADRLPFDDATFDVAVSSFVLQLVPSRAAALREARRVLRTGARLGWVTWLVGGEPFRADAVVDEVLDEFGFDPPERDGRSGDLASVEAAATATRRSGFSHVVAEAGTLEHGWTAEAYQRFIVEFDEHSTFDSLDPPERRRAEQRLLERLRDLPPIGLTMRLPIVYVTAAAR
jgi:ubiquinone/menaquinone biosynthesis C-methylase UbiE